MRRINIRGRGARDLIGNRTRDLPAGWLNLLRYCMPQMQYSKKEKDGETKVD
jgi:hypothetical protein